MLTSLQNPRVMLARRLHRRELRNSERAFLVEGPTGVAAAAAKGARFIDVFRREDDPEDLPPGLEATVVSEPVMRAISDTATPRGPVAIVEMVDVDIAEIEHGDLVLILASVRDPGNAGTLLRSALAAGADGVVFGGGSVDPFGPKTVRASAGAIFGTPVVRDVDLKQAVDRLRGAGFEILGTDANAGTTLFDHSLVGKVALVLGNEAWGLPGEIRRLMDDLIAIPMPGPVESLNVSVAGSLVLFEAVRQRREASS